MKVVNAATNVAELWRWLVGSALAPA